MIRGIHSQPAGQPSQGPSANPASLGAKANPPIQVGSDESSTGCPRSSMVCTRTSAEPIACRAAEISSLRTSAAAPRPAKRSPVRPSCQATNRSSSEARVSSAQGSRCAQRADAAAPAGVGSGPSARRGSAPPRQSGGNPVHGVVNKAQSCLISKIVSYTNRASAVFHSVKT